MSDNNETAKLNAKSDLEMREYATNEMKAGALFKEVMRGKLQALTARKSQMIEMMSENVKKRIDYLKGIQEIHDNLENEFRKEFEELEAKYNRMYEPLYKKRYEIVNGISEVEGVTKVPSQNDVGVPDFWLTALTANEIICWEIDDDDKEALRYLTDIKWRRLDDGAKGFKLEFYFDKNPFFANTILTKTYYLMEDEIEDTLERATGTEIHWYPGKNLLDKHNEGSADEKDGAVDDDEEEDDIESSHVSFFKFFSPVEAPDVDDVDDDDSAVSELQNAFEQDFEIGYTIKDKIIPQAVSWYTGEAIKTGDIMLDMGDSDDSNDDDDSNDSEDDDDVAEAIADAC